MNTLDVFSAITAPPARTQRQAPQPRAERSENRFDDAIRSARETYANDDASGVASKDAAAEPDRNDAGADDASHENTNAGKKEPAAQDARHAGASDAQSADRSTTEGDRATGSSVGDNRAAIAESNASAANKAATIATAAQPVTEAVNTGRTTSIAGQTAAADADVGKPPPTDSLPVDVANFGGRIVRNAGASEGTSTNTTGGQDGSNGQNGTSNSPTTGSAAANAQVTANATTGETTNPLLQPGAQTADANGTGTENASVQSARSDANAAAQHAGTRDQRHALKTEESSEASAAQRNEHNAPARNAPSPAVELAKVLLPEARIEHASSNHATANNSTDAGVQTAGQAPIGAIGGAETGGTQVRAATVVETGDTASAAVRNTADLIDANAPADRLTKLISSSVTPRSSYIKLQLDPPELGQLRLEVRLQNDALTIRAQADTVAAKNLIEERIGELKHALQQQGVRVDRVDVEVRNTNNASNEAREESAQRHAGSRQDAGGQQHSSESADWERHAPGGSEMEPTESTRIADPAEAGPIEQVTTESSVDVLV